MKKIFLSISAVCLSAGLCSSCNKTKSEGTSVDSIGGTGQVKSNNREEVPTAPQGPKGPEPALNTPNEPLTKEPYEEWGDKETINWFNNEVKVLNEFTKDSSSFANLSEREQKQDIQMREEQYMQERIKLMKIGGWRVGMLGTKWIPSNYKQCSRIWKEVEGNQNILYVIPSSNKLSCDLLLRCSQFYTNYAPQILIDSGYNEWINPRSISTNKPINGLQSGEIAISDFPAQYKNCYIAHVRYPEPVGNFQPTDEHRKLTQQSMNTLFEFAKEHNLSIYIESSDYIYANYPSNRVFKFARTIKETMLKAIREFSDSQHGKNTKIYLCSGFDIFSMQPNSCGLQY
jgi:hypothetical protein